MLYIDTNVILDAILERKNLYGRDISTPAIRLFKRVMECEFHIVISTWTLFELKKHLCGTDATFFFAMLKKKTVMILYTPEDVRQAKHLSPPF